jgi:DNA invertase Pin-like site-specific DNA recombinase
MSNIAYLFISVEDKDATGQKRTIQDYAEKKNIRIDNYITVEVPSVKGERNRRMQELFLNVNRWDMVIISDLARIGHGITEIVAIVRDLSERGVRFIAARQGMDLNGYADSSSKATTAVFDMLVELEKDLATSRIKEILAQKKRGDVVLGRPKGSISSSKLDKKKGLIIEYLSKGVSKASLARILDTSPSNLLSYLRTRKIAVTKRKKPLLEDSLAQNDVLQKEVTTKEDAKEDRPFTATQRPLWKRLLEQSKPTRHFDTTHDVLLCRHCGKNTHDPRTTTCAGGYIDYQGGESSHRIPYPKDEKERCPKCGVEPGGFHHDGCYIERCPRCGERLVSCGCKKL